MTHLRNVAKGPLAAAVAAIVAVSLVLFAPSTAGAKGTSGNGGISPIVADNEHGKIKSKISGTTDDGRKVRGTFTPEQFDYDEATGKLEVTGTVDGVIHSKGKPERFQEDDVTFEVTEINTPGGGMAAGGPGAPGAQAGGSCDILNLVLGPLDLDVLGLTVHLDTVVLDIIAESGPGNLLGNLLCQVAGLLDPSSPLDDLLGNLVSQISDLLNQILGILEL